MKNFALSFIAFGFLFLISCGQELTPYIPIDPPVQPQNDTDPRIKTEDSDGNVSHFEFDSRRRVTRSVYGNGAYDIYEYDGSTVVCKLYKADGNFNYLVEYQLNSDSLVQTLTYSDNGVSQHRLYDAQKHMTQLTSTNGGIDYKQLHYFGASGNEDSTRYFQNNDWKYTAVYTYYTDKPNTLTERAYGNVYFGKESKNLLKSVSHRNLNPGNTYYVYFTYTMDNRGRVKVQSQFYNETESRFTYTYF